MVALTSLWLPIVLSAVLVFVLSSVIHMALKYHQSDFQGVPNEDGVQDALRPFNIPPGDYVLPHSSTMAQMKEQGFIDKVNRGPVAFMTVLENGMPGMGKSLVQWFLYSLLVSFFAAYLTSHVVPAGGQYLVVFRFIGTAAFMGYSLALLQNSIWYHRNWGATFKSVFDGLVYALVTAGMFGWLWPG